MGKQSPEGSVKENNLAHWFVFFFILPPCLQIWLASQCRPALQLYPRDCRYLFLNCPSISIRGTIWTVLDSSPALGMEIHPPPPPLCGFYPAAAQNNPPLTNLPAELESQRLQLINNHCWLPAPLKNTKVLLKEIFLQEIVRNNCDKNITNLVAYF